ncbi:oligomeric, coiled-coil, peripheral membrane protein [Ascosphaera acerosa]|nr:oligomeric, coiled-coil, peripheral membrane protein [Ascosphaera acerosa]
MRRLQTYGKVLNIERADLAATRNLSTHLGGMEEEVRARRAWLDTTVDRDARIIAAWDTIAQAVKCIPTPMDFRFLQQNGAKTSDCGRVTGSLLDYVPPEWHHETSSSLSAAIEGLSHTVGTLEARFASIRQEVQRCMQPASYEPISHKVDALHGDIDRIVSTIQADYAHAQKLPRTMSSIPSVHCTRPDTSSEVDARQAETEEVQQLKQENTLLEGRLRGAETRIRRLEDLLHRQGEQGRPISAYNGHTGDQFQPRGLCWRSHEQPLLYESQVMHLRQLNESLQDRLSSEQEGTARLQTELALRLEQEEAEAYDLRQVVESLKSELDKERSTVAQLEAAAAAEREANAATLQDAVSIKRDLLRNIQAQQREFEHERKELEEEIRSLTQKLEEAEDHLEADDKERVDQQVKYAVLSEELLRVQAEHLELMTSAKLQASLAAQERVVRDMLRDCLQQCYATLVPEGDSTDERAMCEQLISVACRAEGRSNDQWLSMCARETSVRLHSTLRQLYRMMEQLGYVCGREGQNEPLIVRRVRHAEDHTSEPQAPMQTTPAAIVPSALNPELHDWAMRQSSPSRQDGYARFVAAVDEFPTASIVSNIVKRMQAIEEVARKWRKKGRAYREQFHRAQAESRSKIAFCEYHVGDLALFLPTKNQPQKAWAAFNVNAPHRFLRFADPRSLASRDWLVARITKIEEHIVDSSRSLDAADGDASSLVAQASGRLSAVSAGECSAILEPQWSEDNPFGFSEGQRWYYLDAVEERQVTSVAGAPTTPGPSKSTVATAAVDVKGNVQVVKSASSRPATAEASPSCASNRDRDSRTSPSQHRLKTTEGPKN